MGKRSDFPRVERDFYPTPPAAVLPLIPHLKPGLSFDEPCLGDSDLAIALEGHGFRLGGGSDIATGTNALDLTECRGEIFITNPPWPRRGAHGDPTVSLVQHLTAIAPVWFLLSADFAHNAYFADLPCARIVSVGRVKWIPDSKHDNGKDNAAWYHFDRDHRGTIEFFGKGPQ